MGNYRSTSSGDFTVFILKGFARLFQALSKRYGKKQASIGFLVGGGAIIAILAALASK